MKDSNMLPLPHFFQRVISGIVRLSQGAMAYGVEAPSRDETGNYAVSSISVRHQKTRNSKKNNEDGTQYENGCSRRHF